MDSYSSGEELVTKTRKPYTITKQRERWTDDEHTRFLEALKLYGRAWQRIEEHIGTKTAVQIRSHAQKFFTKLEKEALIKGLPTGQAIDIEIPPPRPKRKPNNPYPRKTSIGTLTSHAISSEGNNLISGCSMQTSTNILDLDKEATREKQSVNKEFEFAKKVQNQNDCADTLSIFQEAPSAPLCPERRNNVSKSTSTGNYKFKKFATNLKEVLDQDTASESCLTFKAGGGQKKKEHNAKQLVGDLHSFNCAKLGNYHSSHDKLLCKDKENEPKPPATFGLSSSDMNVDVSNPRHVPIHIVNGSPGMSTNTVALDFSSAESLYHQTKVVGENVAAASTTEHQSNALQSSIHRFPTVQYPLSSAPSPQSDSQAFLHTPSTFTSLVAPALLENPVAHAAASFAASFWRVASVEPSAGPDVGTLGDSFSKMINTAPSLEELAAATVTAATAWWASQGLLPLCTSFNAGYTCGPAPMISTTIGNGEDRVSNNEREVNPPVLAFIDQQLDPNCSRTSPQQWLGVESPPFSASKSTDGESEKMNTELRTVDPEQVIAVTKAEDSKKMKDQKLVDRSSCGSNTASSSEVETDALEKHEKKDLNELDLSLLASDSTNHPAKFCTSLNESWKEVSQGGRLAFQALFSRQVLPQSFASPNCHPKYNIAKDKQHINGEKNERLQIDLNSKVHETCPSHKFVEHNVPLTSRNNEAEEMMTMGISYLKFKGHRTGFKPYKRCSAEAKESRLTCNTNQEEAKAPKRMRLEGCAYS